MTEIARSARKEYRQTFAKALTAACKGTGFRAVKDCLYSAQDEWFVAIDIALFADGLNTRLAAQIKPMAIDPIFWDAMALGDAWRRPLWKRHLGLAVRDPLYADAMFECGDRPEDAATQILQHAEAWTSAARSLSLEDYLRRCRSAEKRPFHYFAASATTLVAMSRREEALELCHAAIAAGNGGGYRADKKDFSHRLAELIERL